MEFNADDLRAARQEAIDCRIVSLLDQAQIISDTYKALAAVIGLASVVSEERGDNKSIALSYMNDIVETLGLIGIPQGQVDRVKTLLRDLEQLSEQGL